MNIISILIVVFTFIFMEIFAWFTHKYVMHGFLWNLHLDHHQVDHDKVLQKNDYFFLIFAIPGIACIILGSTFSNDLFWVGMGITLYGFAYFVVHEIIIHQRIKIFRKLNNRYIKAIKLAHHVHHKNKNKEEGESFGMLFVARKFFK